MTQIHPGVALDIEQPGERRPAPGALAVVQAFVNTNDIEGGEERLADPRALTAWLRRAGLLGSNDEATGAQHAAALAIREGLRALGRANNGEPGGAVAVDALNDAARHAPLVARLAPERWELDPHASGVHGALGWLLATVVAAMADGSWFRMKACRRDRCRWLFYDNSRNHSAVWCAMEICGNKEKAHAYRRRRSLARSSG